MFSPLSIGLLDGRDASGCLSVLGQNTRVERDASVSGVARDPHDTILDLCLATVGPVGVLLFVNGSASELIRRKSLGSDG